MATMEDAKESKEDIERKAEIQKITQHLLNDELKLIVDGKGWNIEYFQSNHVDMQSMRDAFLKFQCQSCKNVCRACVEIDEGATIETDPVVMCEVCAIAENKKYAPSKLFRRVILKETVYLTDAQNPDLPTFWGHLSKCINTKIPEMAQEAYEQNVRSAEIAKLRFQNGVKKNLDWKFHDDSRKDDSKDDALFVISEDGRKATSNHRSGTVLFGPFIAALQYKDKKWIENWQHAGNYYVFELKMHDADGCSIGFCHRDFNQFIGKNEAASQAVMLNQSGWFYISRTFQHEWKHERASPMGKWFKSEDAIVVVIDCTDGRNVKGEIYNKGNEKSKFVIEKLPKHICIGVNLIIGSNPTGTAQSGVSVESATVERRMPTESGK